MDIVQKLCKWNRNWNIGLTWSAARLMQVGGKVQKTSFMILIASEPCRRGFPRVYSYFDDSRRANEIVVEAYGGRSELKVYWPERKVLDLEDGKAGLLESLRRSTSSSGLICKTAVVLSLAS